MAVNPLWARFVRYPARWNAPAARYAAGPWKTRATARQKKARRAFPTVQGVTAMRYVNRAAPRAFGSRRMCK